MRSCLTRKEIWGRATKVTIKEAFTEARRQHRAALIPYITAGFPSLDHLAPLVKALEAGGADLIEIGVPFSDPLADGPILQHAATEAVGLRFFKPVSFTEFLQIQSNLIPHRLSSPPL